MKDNAKWRKMISYSSTRCLSIFEVREEPSIWSCLLSSALYPLLFCNASPPLFSNAPPDPSPDICGPHVRRHQSSTIDESQWRWGEVRGGERRGGQATHRCKNRRRPLTEGKGKEWEVNCIDCGRRAKVIKSGDLLVISRFNVPPCFRLENI